MGEVFVNLHNFLGTAARLCVFSVAIPVSLHAQAVPISAIAPSTTEASGSLPEILVTAEKRSVNLQDVPLAVSAYTADRRQLLGVNTLQDLANFTPGLSYSAGNDRVFIRGVGRQTNTNGSDPGVATYTDGIYDSSTNSISATDFFVQRVEILRGPQGTLYGRNSIGGAINAISKRPTENVEAEVRGTLGNYDMYNLEASVSGPIMQGLRARLAGATYNQDRGYFKNSAGLSSEGGKGKRQYVELQLEADLGENVQAWGKVFTSSSDQTPRTLNSIGAYDAAQYPTGAIFPGSAYGYTTPGVIALDPNPNNPGQTDIRRFSTDTTQRQRISNNFGVTGDVKWTLPGFDVRVLGGYQQYVLDLTQDLDGNSVKSYVAPLNPAFNICGFIPGCGPVTVHPSQTFKARNDVSFGSGELNLTSNGSGPFQWVAGVYYYQETLAQQSHFAAPEQPQLQAPVNGPANPLGDFVYAASTLTTKSTAVFGQVDYRFADTLKFTGGVRYTHDTKSGTEAFRLLCFGCGGFTPDQYGTSTPALDITSSQISILPAKGVVSAVAIDPVTGIATRGLSDTWNAVTGTAAIEWQPDRDTLAFARYSRGYKAGGFNAGGISELPETNAEFINAYELGYKRTIGSRLRLNLAGYYYDYRGLQVPLTVTKPGGANLTQFFNLAKSRSYGAEIEAAWQATTALQLNLSYAIARSKVNQACCFVDGQDPTAVQPGAQPSGPIIGGQQPQGLQGSELPETPRNKVAFNAIYSLDFSPGTLALSGSYVWRDSSYANIFNRPYNRTPSFDQVDLRAVWTDKEDRYRVIAYVKNVFDTIGYNGASGLLLASPPAAAATVAQSYALTPPRTFGVQLQVRFK